MTWRADLEGSCTADEGSPHITRERIAMHMRRTRAS